MHVLSVCVKTNEKSKVISGLRVTFLRRDSDIRMYQQKHPANKKSI